MENQSQYGRLVTARFYGPAAGLKGAIVFVIFCFIAGYLSGISFLFGSTRFSQISGLSLIIIITIIIIVMIKWLRGEFKEEPTYRNFEVAGKLDYDLFENGILIKGFVRGLPGNIVTKFIPFQEISEAFITNDENTIKQIIVKVHQLEKNNFEQLMDMEKIDDEKIKSYRKYVWLIINGKPRAMEKFLFKDLHTFEKFLRTKVPVVN